MKGFLQRILQEIMKKKIILGTSDTWSTSCLSHQLSNPPYCIEDCWIFGYNEIKWFLKSFILNRIIIHTKVRPNQTLRFLLLHPMIWQKYHQFLQNQTMICSFSFNREIFFNHDTIISLYKKIVVVNNDLQKKRICEIILFFNLML